MELGTLQNYVDGTWVASEPPELLDVHNPATGEAIARVPLVHGGGDERGRRRGQDAHPGGDPPF